MDYTSRFGTARQELSPHETEKEELNIFSVENSSYSDHQPETTRNGIRKRTSAAGQRRNRSFDHTRFEVELV